MRNSSFLGPVGELWSVVVLVGSWRFPVVFIMERRFLQTPSCTDLIE